MRSERADSTVNTPHEIPAAPLTQERIKQEVAALVMNLGRRREMLIPILQAVQDLYQYLPQEAIQEVAGLLELTPTTILGVATFYSQFRLRPAGRHRIKVCTGTACHLRGATEIYEAFRAHLKIDGTHDTDPGGDFTVEKVACLGCCMLAPAVQIDQVTYGYVKPEMAPEIIGNFRTIGVPFPNETETVTPVSKRAQGEIRICRCSSCRASGAEEVYREMDRQIKRFSLPVKVKTVGCLGQADQAPLIEVRSGASVSGENSVTEGIGVYYRKVRKQDVAGILFSHFLPAGFWGRSAALGYRIFDQWYRGVSTPAPDQPLDQSEVFKSQTPLVTEARGRIDPLNLDEYLKEQGFAALKMCLETMTPEMVIETMASAGLRGRGGAGFPTAEKWRKVRETVSDMKYLIGNGDEGDPGAFMDRMVLESFPFRVIEGILIAAYAVGAGEGFLYIRAEYPLAIRQIQDAIDLCTARGLIGAGIYGSSFSCHLQVIPGAGAFVCGEETALIAAMEGRRGIPRLKPPYPSEIGFRNRPTLINNVETLAAVPWIIRNGAEAFARIGVATSRGTKTFSLAGKILRSGLVEAGLGASLREVVETIGGGVPGGKRLKAVQIGGPSGGFIPAHLLDLPVDYEAFTERGAMMGSGGLIVLDEEDCLVETARYFMSFIQRESCGKCTYCRLGTKRLLEILENLCRGQGKAEELSELEEAGEAIRKGSLCGLGRSAPNPILSLLKYFRSEFEAHLAGKCPAGKCKPLITYTITEACIGCTRCAQRCPADAIAFRPYQRQEIDPTKCLKCGTCKQVCAMGAVKIQ